jgi:hypothetical protein
MRAIWYNIPEWNKDGKSKNAFDIAKGEWRDTFRIKLHDMSYKESLHKLSPALMRNDAYKVRIAAARS